MSRERCVGPGCECENDSHWHDGIVRGNPELELCREAPAAVEQVTNHQTESTMPTQPSWFSSLRFALGDRVSIHIPKDNRDWGYNPCPDGTQAIVLGYRGIAYTDDPAKVGDTRFYSLGTSRLGAHINACWVRLMFDDGREHTEFESRLRLVEPTGYQLDRDPTDQPTLRV